MHLVALTIENQVWIPYAPNNPKHLGMRCLSKHIAIRRQMLYVRGKGHLSLKSVMCKMCLLPQCPSIYAQLYSFAFIEKEVLHDMNVFKDKR